MLAISGIIARNLLHFVLEMDELSATTPHGYKSWACGIKPSSIYYTEDAKWGLRENWLYVLKDTGGELGVLHAAVATPPSGRDQSGPYPRGHRFARLSAAMRHQYPSG